MKNRYNLSTTLFYLGALLIGRLVHATNLPTDWQDEQSFTLSTTGLVKLALPAETLNAARPALEDLRLYDDAGNEVPYLIEYPAPVTKFFQPAKSFVATLKPNSTVINLETEARLSLDGVALQTPAMNFIKAVKVEGSVDGADWQILAEGQPVFRQSEGASQLRISFPSGSWTRLRLTVDDQRSQPVPFTGAFVHITTGQPEPKEFVPVEITERDENPGETRLTLNLGAANLDIASVWIETTEPLFTRQITLAMPQVFGNSVREQSVGRGTIYRIAVAGQTPSENFFVPLENRVPARELFVFIKNGDSPPLAISTVKVERHPVYLVFLARQPGTYHLLTGNDRCPAPRYDLTDLAMNLKSMAVTDVKFPRPTENPDFRTAEVLPGIGENGVPMDAAGWTFRKAVKTTTAGVQQLDLDLAILAHATSEFADLRLLHDTNQIPYIIDQTSISRPLAVTVTVTNDPQKQTVSRWVIKLPQSGLPLTRLTCNSPTSLFKRSLSLYEMLTDEQGDRYRRDLGQAAWTQTPERQSKEFSLALDTPPQSDTIFLETENGDNPPVQLEAFQLFYPVTRILFKAQSSADLFLYYGNPQASRPDYDLSLVAGQLLSAEKNIAALSAEEQLKKSSAHENQMTEQGNLLFWVVLALVVVVLLVIISRLLPKSQPPQ